MPVHCSICRKTTVSMLCEKCKKATGAADRCGTCPRDQFDAFMVKVKKRKAEHDAKPEVKKRKAERDAKPEVKKRQAERDAKPAAKKRRAEHDAKHEVKIAACAATTILPCGACSHPTG